MGNVFSRVSSNNSNLFIRNLFIAIIVFLRLFEYFSNTPLSLDTIINSRQFKVDFDGIDSTP